MIYRFLLLSGENEEFSREVEMQSEQTFLQFHDAIRNNCKYRADEMASFYLCNDDWEKEGEITMFAFDDDASGNLTMDQPLSKVIKEKKQKLIYIFDFYNERGFFVELIAIHNESEGKIYPIWAHSAGTPPDQFMDLTMDKDEFEDEYDLEDDFDPEDSDYEADEFGEGFTEDYRDDY